MGVASERNRRVGSSIPAPPGLAQRPQAHLPSSPSLLTRALRQHMVSSEWLLSPEACQALASSRDGKRVPAISLNVAAASLGVGARLSKFKSYHSH